MVYEVSQSGEEREWSVQEVVMMICEVHMLLELCVNVGNNGVEQIEPVGSGAPTVFEK